MYFDGVEFGMSNIFKFQFDIGLVCALRNAINERINLSMNKKCYSSKKSYNAWNKICAILDRLQDTLEYINRCTLGRCKSKSAFDFYEFINNSYVVIDCIRVIGKIYGKNEEIKTIESSQEIFGDVLNAGGNDNLFFNYIRSLCAVHPIETNHQNYPYLKNWLFHCCPYVVWNRFGMSKDKYGDLMVVIYRSSDVEDSPITIYLYAQQFIDYLNKWINFIEEIIKAVKKEGEDFYNQMKQDKMKNRDDFNDIREYLVYLQSESKKRVGTEFADNFDFIVKIFDFNATDPVNKGKLQKYKNAINYSLKFIHNALQNMSFEGYDNTGIENNIESNDNLFELLLWPLSYSGKLSKCYYNLSKLYYLEDADSFYGDKVYARILVNEIKDILNEFVSFSGNETDFEITILVRLALYLDSLNSKCPINANIPNNVDFRERLLNQEELDILKEVNATPSDSIEKLLIQLTNEDGDIVKIIEQSFKKQ